EPSRHMLAGGPLRGTSVDVDPALTERIEGTQEELDAAWIDGPPIVTGPVVVVEYDGEWPELFQREVQRIRELLGDAVVSIEHVGSTSVPGLAAKPIIDIDLVVPSSSDEATYVPPLEAAGYRLIIREPNWHEHRMLKGPDTNVNLHVFSPGAVETAPASGVPRVAAQSCRRSRHLRPDEARAGRARMGGHPRLHVREERSDRRDLRASLRSRELTTTGAAIVSARVRCEIVRTFCPSTASLVLSGDQEECSAWLRKADSCSAMV
ncbi:MAG: hypothetical protein QOG69_2606, partial [Actinomycetota bacterium]|nr:hypothetical protein [Actinomycetota bacterium]